MPVRLLHTADWQIGRVYAQFEDDDAAALAEARFLVVERLAALANEHAVDAVLVAGDVFDAQTVSDKTLRRLIAAMQAFRGPWLLLPGNHDAALAESVWTRLQRLDLLPAHVIACLEPRPELLPGRLAVLPAPLLQRHTQHDLSDWFASADTPEGLPRVGLAHGFVPGVLPDEIDSSNPIAADRAERAGLDYLALGDWHGSKRIDARTWYAGTPESDRFKDNDSGQALLVDIDGPGALPRVQPLRCGRYRWQTVEAAIAVASDVEQTQRRLAELGADDVVHLRLSGRCDLAADRRLQQAADAARARVRALLYDRQALALQPTDDDIAALQADGYVGDVLQQLRAEQDGAQGERARQALILLASLLQPAGESPAKTAGEARA